jgi:DNA-binding NarL/FixJ family response regulator
LLQRKGLGTDSLREGCPRRAPRVYTENSVFLANFSKWKSYQTAVKKPPRPAAIRLQRPAKWSLTRREIEVLELLRTGAADNEIAIALGVSRSTASKHVENILKKMTVTNRTAAASLSWRAER